MEMIEVTGSVTINPDEVEYHLGRADFTYPRNDEADPYRGWTKFTAIPNLFQWMVRNKKFPTSDEGVAFLLENLDPKYRNRLDALLDVERKRIVRRGHKLYLDFARDMHTWGLLQRCSLLAFTEYQKAHDIQYNVDFLSTLLSSLIGKDEKNKIAIQAAMRARWPDEIEGIDPFEAMKAQRRARRGQREWDGPVYWLTNRYRAPAKKIAGCWLFGPNHINDLAEEVRMELKIEEDGAEIGIQPVYAEQEELPF